MIYHSIRDETVVKALTSAIALEFPAAEVRVIKNPSRFCFEMIVMYSAEFGLRFRDEKEMFLQAHEAIKTIEDDIKESRCVKRMKPTVINVTRQYKVRPKKWTSSLPRKRKK